MRFNIEVIVGRIYFSLVIVTNRFAERRYPYAAL